MFIICNISRKILFFLSIHQIRGRECKHAVNATKAVFFFIFHENYYFLCFQTQVKNLSSNIPLIKVESSSFPWRDVFRCCLLIHLSLINHTGIENNQKRNS